MEKLVIALPLLYLAVGVLSFGHSAARGDLFYADHCVTQQMRLDDGRCQELISGNAFFAGVFWPIYWTWEAWS